MRFLLSVLLLCAPLCASTLPGTLELQPLHSTLGVHYRHATNPASAQLFYRVSGGSTWIAAHDLVRCETGHVAGSLFWLAPATAYDVRVVIGPDDIIGTATTWPDNPATSTVRSVYVDAAVAAGGTGSAASPYNAIQAAVSAAAAGDRILVAPGIYYEEVQVNAAGTAGSYIVITKDPAKTGSVVMEGAHAAPALNWSATGTANVYTTAIPNTFAYLVRDGLRFYNYDDLAGCNAALGHNGVPMSEGWVISGGNLYVRCANAPATYIWKLPQLEQAIQVNSDFVWIEGLEIRYYGLSFPKGIYVRDGSNVVIRNNTVHHCGTAIWVRNASANYTGDATDIRVEGNTCFDSPVHLWPWDAVKGTSQESSAIDLSGGYRELARNNSIYHYFNGIYTGSFTITATGLSYEIEVRDNRMLDITDDGLEPEGACINNRFIGNTIDRVHNGVSLAPILNGPVFVLRNRFTQYDESCIKVSNNSVGPVFIYHNTGYTLLANTNGMGVSGPFANMTFRNNLIAGTRYAYEDSSVNATNMNWNYDNWFTSAATPPQDRIKYNNVRYATVALWYAATTLEQNGRDGAPGCVDPATYKYTLASGSGNINAGIYLPGINGGFTGAAPDIGYLEFGQVDPPVLVPGSGGSGGGGSGGSGGKSGGGGGCSAEESQGVWLLVIAALVSARVAWVSRPKPVLPFGI